MKAIIRGMLIEREGKLHFVVHHETTFTDEFAEELSHCMSVPNTRSLCDAAIE